MTSANVVSGSGVVEGSVGAATGVVGGSVIGVACVVGVNDVEVVVGVDVGVVTSVVGGVGTGDVTVAVGSVAGDGEVGISFEARIITVCCKVPCENAMLTRCAHVCATTVEQI